jgi:hypothetical protein
MKVITITGSVKQSTVGEASELLSTGEGGGTKFLREDGDGTCSFQAAPVTSVSGSTGAVVDGDIDHDSLLNYVSGEHLLVGAIDHDQLLNYVAGEHVVEASIDHDALTNFTSTEHFTQASITAVGTVVSGNVDAAVSAASTTVAGKVELATDAETETGTATTLALTPSNVPSVKAILQNSRSAAYTTVLADAGKHIYHPTADTTARIWTIDSNANVAYPLGTAITFVNDTSGGVITISITSDTLVLAPDGTTGSRTLAANGMATAIKMTTTRWMISGSGLS